MMSSQQRMKVRFRVTGIPTGEQLLRDPSLNKGTAFTEEERDALGLYGLLPPHIHTQQEQVMRVLENYRAKTTDLEKYVYIMSLQDRNETLFYRLVVDNPEELMPIIYTPTVGEACQKYGHIFQRPRGLFISVNDKGRMVDVLRNWPNEDVRVIVVTDGERILGLGDLGINGMGIPVGKLCLYTACAGIHPSQCLPIVVDVGTDNKMLLADSLYFGIRARRLRGELYDELIDEFVIAVEEVFPHSLIQFEDFGSVNAFRMLKKYRDQVLTFNDDIQGTGAVVLAGVYSALRITGGRLEDQKFLFNGSGQAAVGIADMLVSAMSGKGLSEQEARQRCWLFDSRGLVVQSRRDLAQHKLRYAHNYEHITTLLSAVESLQPTAIIGGSGQLGTFTELVLQAMAKFNERPIVFALSNPTSKAECTAEEAYTWTSGRAVFASGSPFAPVTVNGREYVPSQGNNAYIFPGVGLGLLACAATRVTDEMFLGAAKTLAGEVSESDIRRGSIYPGLARMRDISMAIATRVAEIAYERNLARRPRPADILSCIKSTMYEPEYKSYI